MITNYFCDLLIPISLLKKKLIKKLKLECDTPVDPANIEACHRVQSKAKPKKVIIKLSKRKDVFNIWQRKKKLKSVDIRKVGLPQGSLVFVNQSLCSYYKYLWSLCKRLHSKKLIHSFWVSNGNVNLKVRENTPVLLVSHVSDLEKHFNIKGLVGDSEDEFFSYLVVFIIFVRCVSFSCFVFYWDTVNIGKRHLRDVLKKVL